NMVNEGLVFRNNLLPHNEYGVKGDGQGSGNETINTYFPGSVFRRNVMVGGPSADYPPDNFFPPSFDQVGFTNLAGGNYRLASASPYKNAGTDGKDIGCDIDALIAAQSSTPTPTPTLTPTPTPTSTPTPTPIPTPTPTPTLTISNVMASSITSSSAVITWTTSAPRDSQVEYGRNAADGWRTPNAP